MFHLEFTSGNCSTRGSRGRRVGSSRKVNWGIYREFRQVGRSRDVWGDNVGVRV